MNHDARALHNDYNNRNRLGGEVACTCVTLHLSTDFTSKAVFILYPLTLATMCNYDYRPELDYLQNREEVPPPMTSRDRGSEARNHPQYWLSRSGELELDRSALVNVGDNASGSVHLVMASVA